MSIHASVTTWSHRTACERCGEHTVLKGGEGREPICTSSGISLKQLYKSILTRDPADVDKLFLKQKE
jgi:hypothetical protein